MTASAKALIQQIELFNDGTAVVAFMTILGLLAGGEAFSTASVATALAREVLSVFVLGGLVGYGASLMLRHLDSYAVEIITTLALATAGYSLAEYIHVSAPLAVVIMGLVIGNVGKAAMSEATREHLFSFWEWLDELLNLLLFALIGLEVVALTVDWSQVWIGFLAVPVVLFARFASVGIPFFTLQKFPKSSPNAVPIMTWGGLRGGISIALALSLPATVEGRDLIIGVTTWSWCSAFRSRQRRWAGTLGTWAGEKYRCAIHQRRTRFSRGSTSWRVYDFIERMASRHACAGQSK